MADNNVNSLDKALENLKSELVEFGNLYRSLDDAKAAVNGAIEDLKRRSDDQWHSTQKQLDTLSQALIGIQQVANESTNLAYSLGNVASAISSVNFPSRLGHIETVLDAQSKSSQDIRAYCESLQRELAPIAAEIPSQVELNGRRIVLLEETLSSSAKQIMATVDVTAKKVSGELEQLSSRVNATVQTLGAQAMAISTLQAAAMRDFESLRNDVGLCSDGVREGNTAIGRSIDRMRKQVFVVHVFLIVNITIVGAIAWKLLIN